MKNGNNKKKKVLGYRVVSINDLESGELYRIRDPKGCKVTGFIDSSTLRKFEEVHISNEENILMYLHVKTESVKSGKIKRKYYFLNNGNKIYFLDTDFIKNYEYELLYIIEKVIYV